LRICAKDPVETCKVLPVTENPRCRRCAFQFSGHRPRTRSLKQLDARRASEKIRYQKYGVLNPNEKDAKIYLSSLASRAYILSADRFGMAGNQSAEDLVISRASARFTKFSALLLVGIGSRKQERLTNLGNAVALAARYSFDLFLQVRSDPRARRPLAAGKIRLLFSCACIPLAVAV